MLALKQPGGYNMLSLASFWERLRRSNNEILRVSSINRVLRNLAAQKEKSSSQQSPTDCSTPVYERLRLLGTPGSAPAWPRTPWPTQIDTRTPPYQLHSLSPGPQAIACNGTELPILKKDIYPKVISTFNLSIGFVRSGYFLKIEEEEVVKMPPHEL
ncbi:jg17356 [Pararge aegeria aegeria]|uniref:Jg17356 protein n=1 Tax=Pararge aegeria aegeria TaxID=348720 RepID=A0A8S4RQI6_9NEOP|nr:jg17356 [Pararge aegeria aegeria]